MSNDKCMPAAKYAAELRGIADRMQEQVTDHIEREYTASSWRGRLLAVTGIMRYLGPAKALVKEAEAVIEEMETCMPPSSGDDPDPDPDPDDPSPSDNDLEGVKVVGVESGWDVTRYEVVGDISSVEIGNDRIVAKWADMGPEYPDGDFGPFDPGEVHCGRFYIVARVNGELKTWGIEWLRRLSNEHRGTTVDRWAEDELTLMQTLAAKTKGNGVPDNWRPKPSDEHIGFFYASPLVKKRSNIVWVDVTR